MLVVLSGGLFGNRPAEIRRCLIAEQAKSISKETPDSNIPLFVSRLVSYTPSHLSDQPSMTAVNDPPSKHDPLPTVTKDIMVVYLDGNRAYAFEVNLPVRVTTKR